MWTCSQLPSIYSPTGFEAQLLQISISFFYSDQNYHLKRSCSDQTKITHFFPHAQNGFPNLCRSPVLPGPSASMPRLRGQGHPKIYIQKNTAFEAKVFPCVVHTFLASLTRQRTRNRCQILPFTKLCQDVLVRITQKWPANCGNIIPKTWFAKESNLPYLHVWVQNVHVRCCFTIHDTNWRSADNWIPMVNSLKKKNVIWVRISFPTPSSMFKKQMQKIQIPLCGFPT